LPGERERDLRPITRAQAYGSPRSKRLGSDTTRSARCATFANAIDAGSACSKLARYVGTSVEMLDRVYGHLVVGAEQVARTQLDAAVGRSGV
jgi:hypothetical protein